MRIGADLGDEGLAFDAGDMKAVGATRALSASGLFAKHLLDFLLASLGMLCVMPVFILVAILIRLDTPGPIFFRQRRVGQYGKPFHIFKFRTMVDGAHKMGSRLTVKRDPRVTRLGKLLRWSKLDELPQLLNVMRGEMSMIGPRPEDPHFVQYYSPLQRQVLSLRPGIVGPSQIEGRDEVEDYPDGLADTEGYYVDHILPPKLARDLEYVRTATFGGDLRLLFHGVWVTVVGAFHAKYIWRRRRRAALMAVDIAISLLTYSLAVLLRFDMEWPHAGYLPQTMLLIVLVRPPLLVYFGAYQHLARYFGYWDLIALFKAVTVGSIVMGGLTYFVGLQYHPRSVFVYDWALLLCLMSGTRVTLRAWVRRHPKDATNQRTRVIIVGAGSWGELLSRVLLDDPNSGYEPIAFVDESHEKWGSRIHGIKVLGGVAELSLAISVNNVQAVFVCRSDMASSTISEVQAACESAGVDCRILPALSEWLGVYGMEWQVQAAGPGESQV